MVKIASDRIKWFSILMILAMMFGSLADIGVALADEAPTDTPAAGDGTLTEEPTDEPAAEPSEEPTAEPTEEPTEVPEVTPPPKEVEGPAEGDPLLSEADPPTPGSPSGVIYSNTPTYNWNRVSDATRYYLYVYRVTLSGDIKVIDMNFRAGDICTATTCALRPSTKLALGNYKWRVRAYYGNDIWGDYSDWQPFTYASTTVNARTPYGITYEHKPIFTWVEMPGVTRFQIQVYTNKGELSHSQDVTAFSCASSRCSVESSKTFTSGKYNWRIRAQIGSTWYAYSAARNFVLTPDITSDFSSYTKDWKPFGGGTWTLSGGYYWTNGATGKMTSARSNYEYNNFEFEATVRREASPENSSFPANYIALRMGTGKKSPRDTWYPGYLLGYTNAGNFSVWRMNANGSATAIQPWTDSPSVIPNGWNKLGVIADGADLYFFINDDLVYILSDSTFSKGFAGFEAYKSDAGQSRFWVDSASVTRLFALGGAGGASVSEEQAALNAAAASSPAIGSLEEFPPFAQAVAAPEAHYPTGLIYETNPTFWWERVNNATHYFIYLEKVNLNGYTRVFGKTYSATSINCDFTECWIKSPTTLTTGEYRWKVRAYGEGAWGAFGDVVEFTVASPVPRTVSPRSTVYETALTFTWSEVLYADRYQVQVYDKSGKRVVNRDTDLFTCAASECSVDSPIILPLGSYTWKVRAFLYGKWYSYSPVASFIIGDLIDSDFTSDMKGWSSLFGGTWGRSSGNYYTDGLAGKFTSTRYAYKYRDFEFTARVKRNQTPRSSSQPANYIAVRMGNSSKGTAWYSGYLFGYTNAGEYSIWRMNSSGSATAIQPWTDSAAIHINDWNLLKVVADDGTFDFYINGTLVRSFTDPTFKGGYVGFQMYQPTDTSSRFMVDFAYLDLIPAMSPAPAGSDQIEPEQMLLNQEELSDPAADSIEGTP